MGFFSKIKEGLKKTRDKMTKSVEQMLNTFTTIDESLFEELEELLVMGDVGITTAEHICEELKKKVKENGVTNPDEIMDMLRDTVADMLRGGEELHISTKPSVILVIGVNGVGKTTTIGKIASMLTKEGKKVILGAADTFRAAAIEQLEEWSHRAGVDIVAHSEGADPAAVIFDGIQAAKARKCDVLICDTAGRLHNKKNLMNELNKIFRVIEREYPEAEKEVLLVLDATTGQNAISQAKVFKEVSNITGVALTKLDGTAKGGVIIALQSELGLPVKLVGVGEKVDDLQKFNSDDFVEAIFN